LAEVSGFHSKNGVALLQTRMDRADAFGIRTGWTKEYLSILHLIYDRDRLAKGRG
jgi:hypothetical protein